MSLWFVLGEGRSQVGTRRPQYIHIGYVEASVENYPEDTFRPLVQMRMFLEYESESDSQRCCQVASHLERTVSAGPDTLESSYPHTPSMVSLRQSFASFHAFIAHAGNRLSQRPRNSARVSNRGAPKLTSRWDAELWKSVDQRSPSTVVTQVTFSGIGSSSVIVPKNSSSAALCPTNVSSSGFPSSIHNFRNGSKWVLSSILSCRMQ